MFPPQLKARLDQEVEARLTWLEELFKHFHANPELSGQEVHTAARVAQELRMLELEVHVGVGGHGVVGIMDNGLGPCLLIRADMDALPIKEKSGLIYASRVESVDANGRKQPVMHACGHDLHTTCLIGAAAVLIALRAFWRGRVLFIGQPAEEAVGGADLMMKDRLYERFGRPDFGIALHADPFLESGCVALSPGVQSSCCRSIDLTVKGVGGHGASPQHAKDPIVLSAQIIMALQCIISREADPSKMGVITVGAIHGGAKRNIIPETVVMNLTVRAFEAALADQLVEAIERTVNGIAQARGLPRELWPQIDEVETSYPPVFNDPDLTATVKAAFDDLLGEQRVKADSPSNGSEDFSFFGQVEPPVPLLMYHLGVTSGERLNAAPKEGEKPAPLHDARFRVDLNPTLSTGVVSMATAALSVLKKQ